jgi:dTDP-4-dehydrorhamnose reductase
MRILVTGSSGQLGSELRRLTEDATHRSNTEPAFGEFTFVDRAAMPLDQPETFRSIFERVRPEVLINAGAYTAVDKAESEPELAYAVNATAVGVLAALCKEFGTLLIHISTDYVFDGTSNRPYLDTDPVNPLGVYGASKEAGEKLALGLERALVIRTSWVYSYYGKNFVKTMLRLLREKETLGVVSDQVGRPTYAADLAAAILEIIQQYAALSVLERLSDRRFHGIYQYADEGAITWYDLTVAIGQIIDSHCQIRPITTAEYPTPAKRPANSVLNTNKIEVAFGLDIPYWADSLKTCLARF